MPALRERPLGDCSERGREPEVLDICSVERVYAYLLQGVRKDNSLQVLALVERVPLDGLQQARKSDRLKCAALEAQLPDVLQSLRQADTL